MTTENFDKFDPIAQSISTMNLSGLVVFAADAYGACHDDVEKAQLKGIFQSRALELGEDAKKIIDNVFASLVRADKLEHQRLEKKEALLNAQNFSVWLDLDKNGMPLPSLTNFCQIMSLDSQYRGVKYNVCSQNLEIHSIDLGKVLIRDWVEADYAKSMRYIEETYHIYSEQKHNQALTILASDREYNPVKELVEALPAWDGTPRIENFLHKWMGAEDTDYVREVSRLIFSGGINRLYNPGCKFDEVPVLIGTKQGEGKSSIVRWLAINDRFFAECTTMDGQKAIEQLEGAWIVEISEMLGVTKASEQEAVKNFISRQEDSYRKPYARTTSKIPRCCVFIGTTNKRQFLSDKTGGRRFYPVKVSMVGFNLYQMEKDCRDEICLCWAEARDKFRKNEMPNYARRDLAEEYRLAQSGATEDDWREDTIRDYLKRFRIGERVCTRQLMREALCMEGDNPRDPERKESSELGLIMEHMDGWEKMKNSQYINPTYRNQKGWVKVADTPVIGNSDADGEDLPF